MGRISSSVHFPHPSVVSDTWGRKADVGVSRTKTVCIIVLLWTHQFHLKVPLHISILYVSQTVNMYFKGEFRIIVISILNPFFMATKDLCLPLHVYLKVLHQSEFVPVLKNMI